MKLVNTSSPCKNHRFFFTSDWYLHQQLYIASYSFWLSLSLLPPCFNNIIHRSLINVLPPVQLNSSIFSSSSKENEVIAESDNLIFVNDYHMCHNVTKIRNLFRCMHVYLGTNELPQRGNGTHKGPKQN